MSEVLRSGFVAIVGRPNAGKSTLVNALVGEKVAITSARPQTTRRSIRGIVRRDGFELVLVDTPGLHRPRTLLGERLNTVVDEAVEDVDVVVLCLPADEAVGPGDRFIAARLPQGVPRVAAVTKADLVRPERLAAKLVAVDAMGGWADIVPVSAVQGYQVEELCALLGARMPAGPDLYPGGENSDQPLAVRVADLVREAALGDLRDEMPHSVAVDVEDIERREPAEAGWVVRAAVFVERDSQKGIMIGKGGSRLRAVGTQARREIEALLGGPVYLDLRVKVAKDWQRDPKKLDKLGF